MTAVNSVAQLGAQLKQVVSILSGSPFQKKDLSVIQLHDELPVPGLLQLLTEIMTTIDASNPMSPHKGVMIRSEEPEDTVIRMGDLGRILRFAPADEMYDNLFSVKLIAYLHVII